MKDPSSLAKKKKDSTSSKSGLISDAVHEILLKLDPTSIFNCILVSKDWLRLITGPVFRQNYLAAWKDHPDLLLGFLRYESLSNRSALSLKHRSSRLLLRKTTKLGRIMNESESLKGIGDFITKSPDKPLMLFADMHQHPPTFYVANPFSGEPPVQLPPTPAYYSKCTASILSREGGGFRVILATADHIQTFSSRTRMWDLSKLELDPPESSLDDEFMRVEAGMATKRGVVYWEVPGGFVAVYDDTNEKKQVSLITAPETSNSQSIILRDYGVSPDQGSLWCVTQENRQRRYGDCTPYLKIWSFDNDDDGQKGWSLLHHLDLYRFWLFPFNKRVAISGFVSFVPENPNSIYAKSEGNIFRCDIDTYKGEIVCSKEDWFAKPPRLVPGFAYRALTMAELGVWPSSPSSLLLTGF